MGLDQERTPELMALATSQLVSAVNENFVASYRKLAHHAPRGETQETGGAFAFVTGLPLALFNGCVVVGPSSPSALDEALSWAAGHRVPHRVWIEEAIARQLDEVPPAHGLVREDDLYPGMALHPIPEPPALPEDVTVEEVPADDPTSLHALASEFGATPELARRLYPPAFIADSDVRAFIGRLAGRPVASSLVIRSPSTSGVYGVGTLPDARRKGVGAAVSWAAVGAGRAWNGGSIVLQSSPMGLPIYQRIGFRTVVRYVTYGRPQPD